MRPVVLAVLGPTASGKSSLGLALATRVPLARAGDGVTAEFTLEAERTATFLLRQIEAGAECGKPLSEREQRPLRLAQVAEKCATREQQRASQVARGLFGVRLARAIE